MSLAYRALYAIGFTPWEQMAHPQIAGQIAGLFARGGGDVSRLMGGRSTLAAGAGSGRSSWRSEDGT